MRRRRRRKLLVDQSKLPRKCSAEDPCQLKKSASVVLVSRLF
jgi:hypothetical protein